MHATVGLTKKVEWANKPNSVPRFRAVAIICLGRQSPAGSSTLPAAQARRAASRRLLGLAGGGVCRAATVTGRAVRSYRTISPLPLTRRRGFAARRDRDGGPRSEPRRVKGGIFSVALSLDLRRVGVTNHRALPSSDFPPGPMSERSPRPLHRHILYAAPLSFDRPPNGVADPPSWAGTAQNRDRQGAAPIRTATARERRFVVPRVAWALRGPAAGCFLPILPGNRAVNGFDRRRVENVSPAAGGTCAFLAGFVPSFF